MQIETSNTSPQPDIEKGEIVLPHGLIGLKTFNRFQLIADQTLYPFVIMRSLGEEEIDFVTVDPSCVIPNYRLDISDAEAEELGLKSPEDNPLVLNISIIHSSDPPKVTSNLIAPVVVNRQTGIGKQIVLENYQEYSTEHPLILE
jgi:flagellar assembly factor FliW